MLSTLNFQFSTFAQGTAFTYQGRLTVGTNEANGIYDLRFGLFDAASSGAQIGPSRTNAALAVSNGFFAVTLDFTNGAFPGANRWLDIGVRSNGNGAFTALTARQKITPAPYAITASNLTGTLPASQLTGAVPVGVLSKHRRRLLAFAFHRLHVSKTRTALLR